MYMLTMMMIFMSIIFINSSHPIILMIAILFQTLILCMMIWMLIKMSWFSYILFLIFLGGLMVLFIYISSLASNEKFYINSHSYFYGMSTLILILMFFVVLNFNKTQMNFSWTLMNKSFNEIYSTSMLLPTIMTMLYLLITLIVVVKISSKYEGPLRNMIFK